MKSNSDKKKVFLGLSGGVDSSVSAALLKEQGYEVTGVFIKVWHPDFLQCDWKSEMRDAMRVCAKLNIPFVKLDLEEVYKKEVIDYMVAEYTAGRTPNPDVMCNKYVKFGGFFDWAMENGADYVATGHYAQTKDGALLPAIDGSKDQTYFLWTLTKTQLSKTLFPIGHLEKKDVRKHAEQYNLFTSEKKDSQGLCFIGHVDMKEFLKRYIDTKSGDVLDETGEVIGVHDGSQLYTIGERHGFSITDTKTKRQAYYITKKDIKTNTIIVSPQKPEMSSTQSLKIRNINLLEQPDNDNLFAMVRYRGSKEKCTLKNDIVTFEQPQESVSAGQSIVFYSNNQCLGGGIIDGILE